MVTGKLDPTVDRTCFCCIFQTVRNSRKRNTGMNSEGPKMEGWGGGGGGYGSAWNGRKIAKFDDPRWRLPPHSPAQSGRVRRRLTVKIFNQGRLAVLLLPGQRVYQGGGRKRLPWPKPVWPKNGSKRPNSGSISFGECF